MFKIANLNSSTRQIGQQKQRRKQNDKSAVKKFLREEEIQFLKLCLGVR